MHQRKQQKMVQVLRLLPPLWESQMEFHIPGLLMGIWGMNQLIKDPLCVSPFLSVTLLNKERNL